MCVAVFTNSQSFLRVSNKSPTTIINILYGLHGFLIFGSAHADPCSGKGFEKEAVAFGALRARRCRSRAEASNYLGSKSM